MSHCIVTPFNINFELCLTRDRESLWFVSLTIVYVSMYVYNHTFWSMSVYVYVMSQCGSYLQSFSLFLVNASSFINMFVAAVFIIFIPGKRIRLSVNDWRAKGTEQRRAEEPIQHMTRKHFYISYYSMCGVPHTIKAHFLLPSNTRWFYCLVLETNQTTDQPRLDYVYVYITACIFCVCISTKIVCTVTEAFTLVVSHM